MEITKLPMMLDHMLVYGQHTTNGDGWYVDSEIKKLPMLLGDTLVHGQHTTNGDGWYMSARSFLNIFKSLISRIGKPNSHNHYSPQSKIPYPLCISTPLMSKHTKKNKEQYCHWEKTIARLYLVSLIYS